MLFLGSATNLSLLCLQTLFLVQEVPNSVIDVVKTLQVKNNTNKDQRGMETKGNFCHFSADVR